MDCWIDDSMCEFGIFTKTGTTGLIPSDSASWYEAWEAATAMFAVCTRLEIGAAISNFGESLDRSWRNNGLSCLNPQGSMAAFHCH